MSKEIAIKSAGSTKDAGAYGKGDTRGGQIANVWALQLLEQVQSRNGITGCVQRLWGSEQARRL